MAKIRIGHAKYKDRLGVTQETKTWYTFCGRERLGGFSTKAEAAEAAELAWSRKQDSKATAALKRLRAKATKLAPLIEQYYEARKSKHAQTVRLLLLKTCRELKWAKVQDMNLHQLDKWLKERTDIGQQTRQHYARTWMCFVSDIIDSGYLSPQENPFRRPSGRPALVFKVTDADATYKRTGITPEQFCHLLDTTAADGARFRFGGPKRAALYLVAVSTGWRRRGLASLTPDNFNLDGTPATVKLEGENSKVGKNDTKIIPPFVVDRLRAFISDKPKDQPLWRLTDHTAKMLRGDLARAGIKAQVGKARIDLHSLRGTYNTWLHQSGVTLEERQRLMQHSTPLLTSNTYTFVAADSAQNAADALGARLEQAAASRAEPCQSVAVAPNI